jgi:helix-turn-helix protein
MSRGAKTSVVIQLDDETRSTLTRWLQSPRTSLRLGTRVRGVLLLAEGRPYAETARRIGLSEPHLRKWAYRFLTQGLDGLLAKRGERRPSIPRRRQG